mmetsp:Transcript_5272/g.19769  ORF Transcript_5272/g.19769 Transcript_5272/m.19769 type:complete len:485 (-) Transcript_5272:894-2348(-)
MRLRLFFGLRRQRERAFDARLHGPGHGLPQRRSGDPSAAGATGRGQLAGIRPASAPAVGRAHLAVRRADPAAVARDRHAGTPEQHDGGGTTLEPRWGRRLRPLRQARTNARVGACGERQHHAVPDHEHGLPDRGSADPQAPGQARRDRPTRLRHDEPPAGGAAPPGRPRTRARCAARDRYASHRRTRGRGEPPGTGHLPDREDGLPHRGGAAAQGPGGPARRRGAAVRPDEPHVDRQPFAARRGADHGRDRAPGHGARAAGQQPARAGSDARVRQRHLEEPVAAHGGRRCAGDRCRSDGVLRHGRNVAAGGGRLARGHRSGRDRDAKEGLDRAAHAVAQHEPADDGRRHRRRADRPMAGGRGGDLAVRHRRNDRGAEPGPRPQRDPQADGPGAGNGTRETGRRTLGRGQGGDSAARRPGPRAARRTHRARRRGRLRCLGGQPGAHHRRKHAGGEEPGRHGLCRHDQRARHARVRSALAQGRDHA